MSRLSLLSSSLIALTLVMSACTSLRPPFQKTEEGGVGYTIVRQLSPSAFVLQTDFGSRHVDDKYAIFYGYRAVGEECLAKGDKFFDVAVVDPHHFEGYCYPTEDHPALAIDFSDRGLEKRPQKYIVGDLNEKSKTSLKKGDEVILIDNVSPVSVSTFKMMVFRASLAGRQSVGLKIKRGSELLDVTEPIAMFRNSSLGSTQLDLTRSMVK